MMKGGLQFAQCAVEGEMDSQQIKAKKAFVWAFGKNAEGELSIGNTKDSLQPRYAVGLKGLPAKCVASSNTHTAVVTQDGGLFVCGSALHGKLGIENMKNLKISKF